LLRLAVILRKDLTMPIRYRYDQPAALVRVDAAGDLTGADLRDYFVALVRESWWRPGLRILADNRGVTSLPSLPELQDSAIALAQSQAYRGGARVAILVATTLQYGAVRQFQGLSGDDGGGDIALFHDEAEALAWLRDSSAGTPPDTAVR